MNKHIKVLLICISLVTAFTAISYAAGDGESTVGGKTKILRVKKMTGTVNFDGIDSEKGWAKATTINVNEFTWGSDSDMLNATSRPLSGDVARIPSCKISWDENGIYVYINVKDKTPYDDKFASVTHVDSVEYHFDMANKKSYAYIGKNDVQYTYSRTGRLGGWGEMNSNGFRRNNKSVNEKSGGFKQEVYVRCDWHGVASLDVGRKVGFDLQINDALKKDTTVTRRHIIWNSIDNAWTNPATMGTLILAGESGEGAYEEEEIITEGDYKYVINSDNTAEIVEYIGTTPYVQIASELGGLKVTRIGYKAFANNETIESLIIPDSVLQIGESAFASCPKLSSVTLGTTVQDIEEKAFYDCPSLQLMAIPESVIKIGEYAFGYAVNNGIYTDYRIIGYANTVAHEYARANGLKFSNIGQGETSIKFKKKKVTIKKGKKKTLRMKVVGVKKVTFKTSKKKVVKIVRKSIDKVVIKAVGKGKAVITAKAAGKKAKCKVTVK